MLILMMPQIDTQWSLEMLSIGSTALLWLVCFVLDVQV
jgi:hypothetical protein